MKFLKSFLAMAFILGAFEICWAEVHFAKSNGSGFSAVDKGSVESACGVNFAFRDQYKNEIPQYLEPEVIKLSFKGVKLHSSLAAAKAEAQKAGKCVWYTDAEKGELGL